MSDDASELAVLVERKRYRELMFRFANVSEAMVEALDLCMRDVEARIASAVAAERAKWEARLLTPELPPYTHEGTGLPRYGLQWPTPNRVLSVPLPDGYWTPFHLAAAAVAAEREACEQRAEAVFERWGRPEYGLLRSDVRHAIRDNDVRYATRARGAK